MGKHFVVLGPKRVPAHGESCPEVRDVLAEVTRKAEAAKTALQHEGAEIFEIDWMTTSGRGWFIPVTIKRQGEEVVAVWRRAYSTKAAAAVFAEDTDKRGTTETVAYKLVAA